MRRYNLYAQLSTFEHALDTFHPPNGGGEGEKSVLFEAHMALMRYTVL
jgi:hypothetical protein